MKQICDQNLELSLALKDLVGGLGYKAVAGIDKPSGHVKNVLKVKLVPEAGVGTLIAPGGLNAKLEPKYSAMCLNEHEWRIDFYEAPHLRMGISREEAYEQMLEKVSAVMAQVRKQVNPPKGDTSDDS